MRTALAASLQSRKLPLGRSAAKSRRRGNGAGRSGHQPYGIDLELTAVLPSRHIHSPIHRSRSYFRVTKPAVGQSSAPKAPAAARPGVSRVLKVTAFRYTWRTNGMELGADEIGQIEGKQSIKLD